MRVRSVWAAAVLGCLAMTGVAQEGHPLIGTWSGEWGTSAKVRSPLLVILEWKTTTLSGVINPGEPDEAPIRGGTLDSTKWTVHLEADSKDEKGSPVKVVLDGKLEDIGSHNRTLTGTLTRGGVKGDFKLTRE